MFCPKCRYEYQEGIIECSDCKIPLTSGLPLEKESAFIKYKEVTSNLRQDEIAIIKSILEARGIVYAIQGEAFGSIRQVPSTIRLVVQESQYDDVLELLADFM